MMINATFNNISVILWAVSFIGGVPGENAYVLLNLISVSWYFDLSYYLKISHK